MLWAACLLVVAPGLAFAGLMYLERDELQDQTFADLRAAGGSITWLPYFTPSDARDIRLDYDMDSGYAWGAFTSAQLGAAREHCAPVAAEFRLPAGPRWFPRGLKAGATPHALANEGYAALRCWSGNFGNFTMAIKTSEGRAYYWSAGGR